MDENPDRSAGVRKTAIILGLVALAFYLAFIYFGIDRS